MTWAAGDIDFVHSRSQLAERFPGSSIEILDTFDIAYVGWEGDYRGALVRRDGVLEIVIVDRTGADSRPDLELVRLQLAEYRRLIDDTERVLMRLEPSPPLEDDWTPDDDRAVAAGQVAELLDAMSAEQIERVRATAQEILRSDNLITSIDTRRRPALHLQIKARDFIAEVYDLAERDEIEKAVSLAIDERTSSGTSE